MGALVASRLVRVLPSGLSRPSGTSFDMGLDSQDRAVCIANHLRQRSPGRVAGQSGVFPHAHDDQAGSAVICGLEDVFRTISRGDLIVNVLR